MSNLDYIVTKYYFKETIKEQDKKEVISKMIEQGFQVEKISKKYITFIKFI